MERKYGKGHFKMPFRKVTRLQRCLSGPVHVKTRVQIPGTHAKPHVVRASVIQHAYRDMWGGDSRIAGSSQAS